MNKPCKLARVKGGGAFRTNEIVGVCDTVPVKGRRFTMAAAPLTPGTFARLVTTSLVETIAPEPDGLLITTENSTYLFTDLSHIVHNPDDLAKAFADTMKGLPDGSDLAWNDFFDANAIPLDARSDFAVTAILKQAKRDYDWNV